MLLSLFHLVQVEMLFKYEFFFLLVRHHKLLAKCGEQLPFFIIHSAADYDK